MIWNSLLCQLPLHSLLLNSVFQFYIVHPLHQSVVWRIFFTDYPFSLFLALLYWEILILIFVIKVILIFVN